MKELMIYFAQKRAECTKGNRFQFICSIRYNVKVKNQKIECRERNHSKKADRKESKAPLFYSAINPILIRIKES